MTIASAFNDIVTAQGGTPSTDGTITGALDALNDTLSGSDQQRAQTIEEAVRMLGNYIGGSQSHTLRIDDEAVTGSYAVTVDGIMATLRDDTWESGGSTINGKAVDVNAGAYTAIQSAGSISVTWSGVGLEAMPTLDETLYSAIIMPTCDVYATIG